MDLSPYLQARQLVSSLGGPIDYLILVLAGVLLVTYVFEETRPYRRPVALGLFFTMLAGYLLLVWYHYQIYANLTLVNPANGAAVGRWAIPIWIEGEKFYLWALLVGLWTVVSRQRQGSFRLAADLTFAGFAILAALFSNPFASPLPMFNQEISQLSAAFAGGNLQAQMSAFGAAFGKMMGYYNSSYMWIHPFLLFLAYSTFVISFLGCLFMLREQHGPWDKIAYTYAKPGYIVLTIGILLGYPWAIEAWSSEPWWYSPKINVTLMMWALYSAYLHSRVYMHRRGMRTTAAVLGILGFAAVVVTYVTTYLIPGVHSVAGS